MQDGIPLLLFIWGLLWEKNTSALEVSGSLPVVDVACISSVAWRFGGPIDAGKPEATPKLEIEAYVGPCQ
jgi:hypothetical protein